jgi:MerR family transcriptional regulator/heat shock protein HspR
MAKGKTKRSKTTSYVSLECYYTTETVSQLLSLSPQTIHYYRRRGLIRSRSTEADKEKGVLYSRRDIETLKRIKHLTKELGVNLAGVEIILNLLERLEREED